MIEIVENRITLTKGDSASIYVNLEQANGTPYTMRSGDKLVMTVRKRIGHPVMMQVDSTTNNIDMTPTDTKKLDVGACCYDIQLNTVEGDIFTVVGVNKNMVSNMMVLAEVTE